ARKQNPEREQQKNPCLFFPSHDSREKRPQKRKQSEQTARAKNITQRCSELPVHLSRLHSDARKKDRICIEVYFLVLNANAKQLLQGVQESEKLVGSRYSRRRRSPVKKPVDVPNRGTLHISKQQHYSNEN